MEEHRTCKKKGKEGSSRQAHHSLPPNPPEKSFLGEGKDKQGAGHLKVFEFSMVPLNNNGRSLSTLNSYNTIKGLIYIIQYGSYKSHAAIKSKHNAKLSPQLHYLHFYYSLATQRY